MKLKLLGIFMLFFLAIPQIQSQSGLYIEGKVLDAQTKKPIPFATIRIQNKSLGLYASEEGGFSFRMRKEFNLDTLIISSIGYYKRTIPFNQLQTNTVSTIYLEPALEQLDEVIVSSNKKSKREQRREKRLRSNSKSLIREAIRRIPMNYPVKPFKLTSYYRDYLKRKGQYYNLNEAIVQTVDSGFNTLHYNNKFRLLYYGKNKDFPRETSIPEKYDTVWKTPDYMSPKKFIPYATLQNQGGNELFILLAHDPIRNYKIRSFSFIYRLSKDFLKNHRFKKIVPVFQDDRVLYKVEFSTLRTIRDDGERMNAQGFVPENKSHYVIDSSGEKVSDAVLIKGEIYINPEDFTIHRLNYKGTLKSSNKKIYALSLEYGYADASETSMKLNYVSFNNEFFALEPSQIDPITLKEKNVFKVEWFKRTSGYVVVFMNAPVDAESATNKESYNVTNNEGKFLPIKRVEAEDNRLRIYFRDPNAIYQPLNIEISKIRDVNGRVINQRRIVQYYQYRELFVQEYDEEIPFNTKCFMENLPLKKNCISRSPNLKNYLINSPLSNNEVLK